MDGGGAQPEPEPGVDNAPGSTRYARNVRRVFVVLFFAVAASAVALGPLFDAYLLNVGGPRGNVLVGTVESTRGILQLALAFPIGALSDRIGRVPLLRHNLPIWTVGLCLVLVAVLSDTVWLIYVSMVVWAPCSQCWTSSAQVLVADFVPPKSRTKTMADLTSVRLVANSLGPCLQLALLLILRENHWENWLLRWLILAGCAFWPGVIWFSLAIEPLPVLERAPGSVRARASNFREEDLDRRVCRVRVRWLLAVSLEVASLVTSIGAGMTVKFFPLFFRVDYHFTPVEVCLLSLVYPLCIAGMTQVIRRIADRLGRLQATLACHFLATACLWALCYCRSLYLVLPFYLLRGALMNAKGPIIRAIIMDIVSADVRGRWNSIQSISTFTWSGSAALGGIIADAAGDYRFTFVITAIIYTVSGVLTLLTLLVYPSEKTSRAAPPVQTAQGAVQLLEPQRANNEDSAQEGRDRGPAGTSSPQG